MPRKELGKWKIEDRLFSEAAMRHGGSSHRKSVAMVEAVKGHRGLLHFHLQEHSV